MAKLLLCLTLLLLPFSTWAKLSVEKLAKKNWIQVTSTHFRLTTDAKPKLGKKIVQDLENYRYFIAFVLNLDLVPGGKPLKHIRCSSTIHLQAS